jgi:hypothetical protein
MTVAALVVAACGGGGSGEVAPNDTGAASTEETSDVTSTETTSGSGGSSARRARLPGPPGPVGPLALVEAIDTWHALVEAAVPGGNCRPLLDSVRGPLGVAAAQQTGGPPYVALYRGIAEGCLGQLQAARSSLGQARQVGLGPDEISTDFTCNAQRLLVFAFATFLNQEISPTCPRPTTTIRASTTTTRPSTTTTRITTTTTTRIATTTTTR